MSWDENANVCGTVAAENRYPNATDSDASSASSQSSRQQAGDETPPPPSHPTVAVVRAKLADASPRKEATPDDLAALRAFYGELTGPPPWITTSGFSAKGQAIIEEIGQADDWGISAELLDPPAAGAAPSTTDGQAMEEIRLSLAILRYARYARGGRLSLRRVSTLFYQKPPVLEPKTIISDIALTIDPTSYLHALHPKHEQFERLRQALIEARKNASENETLIQRLIINLERWRWMPAELGSTYVWNNIPELKARIVQNDRTIYEERIIVGKSKTPTPIFSASMQSIVFHPEWLLPKSVVQEQLEQGSETSTSILKQRNLKVRLKGSPVDPETVDWSAADLRQYTFVQPPGSGNALGKLKFHFPNRHAVYMHDTSQPELFNETNGALSHGCIRLRDPERLAALILAEDKGWSEQQVSEMLNRRKTKWVRLTSPVPVHLTYFTIRVGDDGELATFIDVYGLDGRMGSALLGRSSKLDLTP